MYPNVKENIPKDAPTPKGKGLKIIVEVNVDHAYDLVNRHWNFVIYEWDTLKLVQ